MNKTLPFYIIATLYKWNEEIYATKLGVEIYNELRRIKEKSGDKLVGLK